MTILNPRRFITEDEVVGALHGIGAPVTALEVAQRLKVRATLVANRLSRLATYGKIARSHVTETIVNGTGLNRTYCLWSVLPKSLPPSAATMGSPPGGSNSGPDARPGSFNDRGVSRSLIPEIRSRALTGASCL